MDNLAYDYTADGVHDELDYELIGGNKFFMAAAAPFINHITVVNRISRVFCNYVEDKNNKIFVMTEVDVYLSDSHHYRPDLVVLCDLDKISSGGERIYGAPDLVVEVLSKRTMYNVIGPKKAAYEKYGVKEYWIVDPWIKRIEVYHLVDGKFILGGSYMDAEEDEDDKPEMPIDKIKVSIFEDLIVDVKDIFKWWLPKQ